MDISRFKKVLAGLSASAIMLSPVSSVFAAYSDVASGVWFEEAVSAFTDNGILDASQPRFRGGDNANRAEFVKLLVMLNGGLLSTPPAVASFDDVGSSAWYYAYMEEAAKEQWVRGDGNCYGTHPCYARPGANINRAEAAALIVRAFGLEATGAAPQFVDNPGGQWYTESIQTSADHCVLQGDDSTGRVRPSDNMNRAEMVVMLYRVDQGLSYGVDCGDDGGPVTVGMASVKATSSKTVEVEFSINMDKTSAETASHYSVTGANPEVSVTSAKLVADDTVELTLSGDLTGGKEYTVTATDVKGSDGTIFSDSDTFTGYTALPTSNSTLSISVSSKNPVGDTIPQGAVGVTMLSIDITASCDDQASITDLTVLHEGFGDENDIDGVYATVNGARISRKRTIDSKDQTASIHLSNTLQVAACKTVTVDIAADFNSTATTSAEHNLAAELPSDITTNAKQVTGNFPLRGSTFKVAAVRSGRVSIEYRTVSPDEVEVGDKGVVVGKFQISTDSTEDQTVYSMTIENDGTVHDGDLTNLKLRRSDGTVLTNTVETSVGDFMTFVFDPPFTVLEGDKLTMDIIADVIGGAGDTAKMHFEETSDIFAVGSLYGYGVNGQLYGSRIAIIAETSTLPATVTIDAGEFTIEIDGPSQQSYTRDQNEAVLANIIFTTGGERVNVRKLFVAVEGKTSTGATLASSGTSSYDAINEVLENVQLRNKATGRSIDAVRLTDSGTSGQTASVGTYQIYRFDDFTVNGKETYELRVDFIDNGSGNHPKNGDTFKIHICGEPTQVSTGTNTVGCTFGGHIAQTVTSYQMQVEGLSTGDKVNDVRPRNTITGNSQRIADANLTIAVKATGTSDVAVKNSKNINLFRFESRAGEAKDILLTKFIFNSGTGATSLQNGLNYTLWVDTDGDGKVDTVLEKGQTSQSNKVTFAQLTGGGFVIPKEKTVVFEVHSDIAASLTNDDLLLAFSTADTFVEAETVDRGSSLSGIKLDGSLIGGATSADITVSTVTAQRWALVSQGDLFVSVDTTPVRNRQLLGGALGDTILRLNLHSENEDIDVTDIQLNSSGSIMSSVDRLELFKEGSTTSFGSATIGGCGSDRTRSINEGQGLAPTKAFCLKMQNRSLVVPKGSDVKVLVKARIKSDVDGAISGTGVQLYIPRDAAFDNANGSGAIRARGDQSSNTLAVNDGDTSGEGEIFIGTKTATTNSYIVGNRHFVVLSQILTIANANPDANGSNIPTDVSNIGQFKISAAPNGNSKNGLNKVLLSGVVFNVNATNVGMDTSLFKFYNKSNSTVTEACTAFNPVASTALTTSYVSSGSFVVYCSGLSKTATSLVNATIDPGSDQTFVLQAKIINPKLSSTSTSTLQVSIVNFDSFSLTTFGVASTLSHFEWVDSDNSTISAGHTTSSSFLWVEYPETTIKSTSYQG
ncbi:MAG: hypothetical protein HOO67_06935 [Candidatus Peribacteraceae bacterium]|nr:hypothetical protein [Candidatus Peribacteraceae bacterium]